MSDTTTGTRPDPDELASAYLDGELDAAQRAAVEADPTLLARVDELAAARAAVAGPVAVAPPDVQAAALAAALDVHDQLWATRPVPAPEKVSWWQRLTARRLGPALAGAALVAVAAVGVVAVIDDNGSSGGSTDFAASAPETTAAAASAGATEAVGTAPAALSAAAAPAPDLGSVDDEQLQPLLRELPAAPKAVVAEVEAAETGDAAGTAASAGDTTAAGGGAAPSEATASPDTTDAAETAPDTTVVAAAPPAPATYPPVAARTSGSTCPPPEGTVFYGTLDVDGAPAEVFVGTSRAVALAVDGCTVLAEVSLP